MLRKREVLKKNPLDAGKNLILNAKKTWVLEKMPFGC